MPDKSLLLAKVLRPVSAAQERVLMTRLEAVASELGLHLLLIDDNLDVSIHADLRPLIEAQIQVQQETNALMIELIEAIDSVISDEVEEISPSTFLDGTPITDA